MPAALPGAVIGALVFAAAVLTGGCGWQDPVMSSQRSRIEFPTTPTVPGPELVRLWAAHSVPCDHPIGIGDLPADPYQLLPKKMWPSTADVADKLRPVTAAGDQEFILGRLRVLGAVLRQAQTEMASQVIDATRRLDAAGADPTAENAVREQSTQALKLDHDSYVAALDHVVGELEFGASLPSAQIGHKYRMELVCPDG